MLLCSLRYDDTRWDLLLLCYIVYEFFLKDLWHKVLVIDHSSKLDQVAIFFLDIYMNYICLVLKHLKSIQDCLNFEVLITMCFFICFFI